MNHEIVYRTALVDAPPELCGVVPSALLDVAFVCDRQERPHIILACKQLTARTLGLDRKPSFFDLPPELQASLLELQMSVAKELTAERLEVHLGGWVSGNHIHAHIVAPLLPYFELHAMLAPTVSKAERVQRRERYVTKTQQDHARYHQMDDGLAHKEAASNSPQHVVSNLFAFDRVAFDADESGTASIDITFKNAPLIMEMTREELCGALEEIRALCSALIINDAHLLLPAPATSGAGTHQDRTARLVVRPDVFVLCLPPHERLEWYSKWARGDPIARAYKEDMQLLSVDEGGGFSLTPAPSAPDSSSSSPRASAAVKRKPCKFFNSAAGCRFGERCTFLH